MRWGYLLGVHIFLRNLRTQGSCSESAKTYAGEGVESHPSKNEGWGSRHPVKYPPSNIPTLNFAKNAKFRMGHPTRPQSQQLFLHEHGDDITRVGLDLHGRLPAVHDHKVRVSNIPGAAVEGRRAGTVRVHAVASLQRKALNGPAKAGRFCSSDASQTIQLDLTVVSIRRQRRGVPATAESKGVLDSGVGANRCALRQGVAVLGGSRLGLRQLE